VAPVSLIFNLELRPANVRSLQLAVEAPPSPREWLPKENGLSVGRVVRAEAVWGLGCAMGGTLGQPSGLSPVPRRWSKLNFNLERRHHRRP
jgi:hypothetical protein